MCFVFSYYNVFLSGIILSQTSWKMLQLLWQKRKEKKSSDEEIKWVGGGQMKLFHYLKPRKPKLGQVCRGVGAGKTPQKQRQSVRMESGACCVPDGRIKLSGRNEVWCGEMLHQKEFYHQFWSQLWSKPIITTIIYVFFFNSSR